MYASATYLKIKGITSVIPFFKHVMAIQMQIKVAPGIIKQDARVNWRLKSYTLSTWESKEHMLTFMRSGAHAEAMKQIGKLSSYASNCGWECTSPATWDEAFEKLKTAPSYFGKTK
jgi:hypothetical protein